MNKIKQSLIAYISKHKKMDIDSKFLIEDIALQYIDMYKLVKKLCGRGFTKDEIAIIFVKTEQMFNAIQCQNINTIKQTKKDKIDSISDKTKEMYS